MKLCERINQLCNECMEGKYERISILVRTGIFENLEMDVKYGIVVYTNYGKLPNQYHEDEIMEQDVFVESSSTDPFCENRMLIILSPCAEYKKRKAEEIASESDDIDAIVNEAIEYMRSYAKEQGCPEYDISGPINALKEASTKKEALNTSAFIKKYFPMAISKWRSENA